MNPGLAEPKPSSRGTLPGPTVRGSFVMSRALTRDS
jgi:hypothetical protein